MARARRVRQAFRPAEFRAPSLRAACMRSTRMRLDSVRVGPLLFLTWIALVSTAHAQAPAPAAPKLGSSNSTDLGLVIATGNSRSTSVGLRNVYLYRWRNA